MIPKPSPRLVLAALLTCCLGAFARAADPPGSPEAALARSVEAMNQDRIDDFAADLHPEALTRFHTAAVSMVESADKAGKSGQVLPLFDGVKSVAELKKLDERRFMAAFLRGTMKARPELKKMLAGAKTEMLGHVDEGKDSTHVVYKLRLSSEGVPTEMVTVNSLKKDGTRWAPLLSGDMDGMVVMMKQQIAGKPVLPNLEDSQIHPIGRLVKSEAAGPVYVVYRLVLPMGGSSISSIAVATVQKTDPGYATAVRGKTEGLDALVREKVGLPLAGKKE